MSKVKIDEIKKNVEEFLENYQEEINEDVKEIANKISKNGVEKVKQKSPDSGIARQNKYKEGWSSATRKKNNYRYLKIIHNKTNPQLPHLLEWSHATRNGKMTNAQPHIREVEQECKAEFEKELTDRIRSK